MSTTINNNVNINFGTNINNFGGLNPQSLAQNANLINNTMQQMDSVWAAAAQALSMHSIDFSTATPPSTGNGNTGINPGAGFPTGTPNPADATHGKGLEVGKDGKITTPGGYTIEQMGQFEWKVTGPDKKETRVWGDPHVEESDGGKWDFKKNTEFVLGDGTRIDVTTKPYGNGATVTGQLDIVNGNSHVQVTDIDKGKGKVGQLTHDGANQLFNFASSGANRVTMGATTADWNLNGHEITGSENQGETLKTKEQAGTSKGTWQAEGGRAPARNDPFRALQDRFGSIMKLFDQLQNPRAGGFNPFSRNNDMFGQYNRGQHRSGMEQTFNKLHNMLNVLQRQMELGAMMRARGPQMF